MSASAFEEQLKITRKYKETGKFGLDNWMVAWSPKFENGDPAIPATRAAHLEIGPWPDYLGWSSQRSSLTSGCCYSAWHALKRKQKLQHIVNGFFYLTLGCGFDPQIVHHEFMKIEGYDRLRLRYLGHPDECTMFQKGLCSPYYPG
jgi:hypothetical protein